MGTSAAPVGVRLQFGVLGSLRIAVDGREVELASRKQRDLLGVLLVDTAWVVSTDRLAELMWGDAQPSDPAGAVHTHVSRLRSLLQLHAGVEADRVLLTRPPGYLLAVDPEQVDAGRFQRLVEAAQSAAAPQTTADLIEEALRLWRGPAFAEFDHELTRTAATRLSELRVHAQELRADALLALHKEAQVVGDLEAAVADHPLREGLRGRLMVALTRCGRQADALAVYRDLRHRLVGELGVEPSAALRELEQAVLRQGDDLTWPPPAEGRESDVTGPPTSREGSRRPATGIGALAPSLTSLVGRETDVAGIVGALARGPLVVLTGVGGVGKSRLAVCVAEELADTYPDGVALCDLVAATDSATVADVVATTLGVVPADGGNARDAVVDALRAQRRLLVLDHCEHVLTGASELVDRIVRSCPAVDVLATSRQLLAVAGQQVWPVRPLDVGEHDDGPAVALFGDRAAAVDPAFDLDDAARATVGEICRRLDGLPLAIELAAARVRSMTPADIIVRLDDRFALLTDEPRVVSSRHQSLLAVVEWSYGLLPDQTRRLFERLTVFAGGFALEAAEQVCSGDGVATDEVADRLAELVDHSLLVADRTGRHVRYRMLETLRAYGRARLEASDQLESWRGRHATLFTALARKVADGMEGPDERHWVRLADTELANFRSAHEWACTTGRAELALRLAAELRTYAYYRLRDEVFDWALRALDLPGAAGLPAFPAARLAAAVGCLQRGQLAEAADHAAEALAMTADPSLALRARRLLAEVALYRGDLELTARLGAEVVEQARTAGRDYDEALGHLYRVHAATYAGQTESALAELEAGWRVVERTGVPTLEAAFHFLEGEVRLDADTTTALAGFRQAITIGGSVGNRFVVGVARVSAASLEARHGQPQQALAAFRAIIEDWRRSGDWTHMWTTLHNLVVLLERIGSHEPAATLLGAIETASTGAPAFGTDADRLAGCAASLRDSLGDMAFRAAVARGRHMSDEDAIAHALDETDRLLEKASADAS